MTNHTRAKITLTNLSNAINKASGRDDLIGTKLDTEQRQYIINNAFAVRFNTFCKDIPVTGFNERINSVDKLLNSYTDLGDMMFSIDKHTIAKLKPHATAGVKYIKIHDCYYDLGKLFKILVVIYYDRDSAWGGIALKTNVLKFYTNETSACLVYTPPSEKNNFCENHINLEDIQNGK